jgi:hypothetical protein
VTSGVGCLRNIAMHPESQCPSAYRVEGVSRCLNSETLNSITISSSINQSISHTLGTPGTSITPSSDEIYQALASEYKVIKSITYPTNIL